MGTCCGEPNCPVPWLTAIAYLDGDVVSALNLEQVAGALGKLYTYLKIEVEQRNHSSRRDK